LKVGLLSFHFYNTTAEGLATAKLARALTDSGHAVTVFTSLDNPLHGTPVINSDGLLSGITIHRVEADPDLVPGWWTALEKRVGRNATWDKLGAVPNLAYGCTIREWAWVQNVSRKTVHIFNSEGNFDVLHTRLNHPISHFAGLQVTRQLRQLPWCAYFSDPWPHHLYPEPYEFTVGPASRYRSERILDRILKRAGSYVFPSARLRNYLLQGKRARFLSKAFVAPHLTASCGNASAPDSNGTLRIRHSGFLMRERKIGPMLDGVRAFFSRRPNAKLSIEFAGRYQGNVLPVAPADLLDVVSFHPYMDPDAIGDWLQGADVFLLVEAKMKEGIYLPSKLSEYLGGGRPILALSPTQGVLADCLQEGGGIVVEPDDVNGISVALSRLYEAWETGRLNEMRPNESQVQSVSPSQVVPIYEKAFQSAIEQTSEREKMNKGEKGNG
jgi:glycosyltransferase involved in cell wall biosynthesis